MAAPGGSKHRSSRISRSSARSAGAIALLLALFIVPRSVARAGSSAPNVVPLTMKTPHSGFNRMVVSVTLCAPGTDRCATIDDVMVDTGSTGLRIEASALPAKLRLPSALGPTGTPLAECLRFVHDAAWGPLDRADLRLGALKASDIIIQVIADGPHRQPEGCPPSHVHPTSNGTLGIGPHLFDCQGNCEQVATKPGMFASVGGAWEAIQGSVPERYRVPNPVARFPMHNNGIVIELPAPPDEGSAEVTGTLTFGVGTTDDNRLGSAHVVQLDRRGYFTTLYDGTAYPESYIDSGTMTYIFRNDRLARCRRLPWAFCVAPPERHAATIPGQTAEAIQWSFVVGDYQRAMDRRFGAATGVAIAAAAGTKSFVWGAPSFLGKRIWIVLDGTHVPGEPGLSGPFFATE